MDERIIPLRKAERGSDLPFEEVTATDWERVDQILARTKVESNFTCFPQLMTYAVKQQDSLYICYFQGEVRLILHRRRMTTDEAEVSDVRILFSRRNGDEELIEKIQRQLNPHYIGYNLIHRDELPTTFQIAPERHELVVHIPTVLEVNKLLKYHDYCSRRHPDLSYVAATEEHKDEIMAFLDEWCSSDRVIRNIGPGQTAFNDRRFIDLFLKKEFLSAGRINGAVVFNGDKMVGMTFHTYHPSRPPKKDESGLAVSIIMKNLDRDEVGIPYKKFGQWLKVEELRQLEKEGYSEGLIGGDEHETQAKFKYQFMQGGRTNTYYSCPVYCDPSLIDRLPENYLRNLWE